MHDVMSCMYCNITISCEQGSRVCLLLATPRHFAETPYYAMYGVLAEASSSHRSTHLVQNVPSTEAPVVTPNGTDFSF